MKKTLKCDYRRSRGMALPIVIGIVLVVATLVLAVVFFGRTTGKLQKQGEKQIQQSNTAEVVKGKMQEIFAGGSGITPDKLKEIGMSEPPPAAGGKVATFKGKVGNVEFSGSFNGGDGPWSTYVPIPKKYDPKSFGYKGTPTASFDPNMPLPPNHSRIYVTAKSPDEKPVTYYFTYSNNSPYGLAAPKGNIYVKNAAATTENDLRKKSETGQNFYLSAADKIEVKGKLTGTARTKQPASANAVQLGDPGSGQVQNEFPPIPPEMEQQIMQAMEMITKELEDSGKDPGILELAMMMAATAATTVGNEQLIGQGGFSFDGKNLVWGGSMIVPSGMSILIPINIKIDGDLILMKGSYAIFGKDAKIDGHLFIGKESAVMCGGKLDVKDRVEITFGADDLLGINAAIIAQKDIRLRKGVRHCKFTPGQGSVTTPFKILPNPFDKIPKLKKLFNKIANKLFKNLAKAWSPVSMLLAQTVPIPMGSEDMGMPGLLLVSLEKGVHIQDNGADAGLAGLIICKETIFIEFPNEGNGIFAGIMISLDGDIKAYTVDYRYYPYYASALIPTTSGGKLLNIMPQPHLVASGVYKKEK